jgi:hypothetical protein
MSDFSLRNLRRPIWAEDLPFPERGPGVYEALANEPSYDPRRHLALELPANVRTLADFAYAGSDIANVASPVAITSPFRLLSDEGVAAMRQVALALRDERIAGERTASFLTGGVYRSKFLRNFCACPVVIEFLSRLAETRLMPHSMPSQQIYVNYAPQEIEKAVDTWHTDGIGFDVVILASDPASFTGGEFQFFKGSKFEAARLLGTRTEDLTETHLNELPADRIETVTFPAAGYAVFQNGAMVVHRANSLRRVAERITLVPGYVARDVRCDDPTHPGVADWGEPGIRAEFARHKASCARARLDALIRELPLTADDETIRRELRWAIRDVESMLHTLEPKSKS